MSPFEWACLHTGLRSSKFGHDVSLSNQLFVFEAIQNNKQIGTSHHFCKKLKTICFNEYHQKIFQISLTKLEIQLTLTHFKLVTKWKCNKRQKHILNTSIKIKGTT